MLDWATGFANELITFLRIVVVVIAIFSIAKVWYLTQALIPVLGAIFLAGIGLWAVSPAGLTKIETWIGQDTALSVPGPDVDGLDVTGGAPELPQPPTPPLPTGTV